MLDATAFLLALAALGIGHIGGDVIAQTHRQAVTKTRPGRDGAAACLAHAVSYTAVQAWTVAVLLALVGVEPRPLTFAAAILWSGASHYALDRGPLLVRLAEATGSGAYVRTGAGRLLYDQSCHAIAMTISAAVMAV